ncbi:MULTISPECIES: glycoside hydrolase family 3 C-terminal domain-containing protein [Paenibacillus]|uniref:glycoside hydrolase family 3 C-terminal domain-containing protein n=1 Tax=Paenibacillus TaxID=44249 RepID=UPI0022B8B167|nr:glycoside hydrolase family 3 C-terminal domain-containing protein [Paenibacillus caseinilyticus]MCZ8521180.1 glycoside hydrolase family 3 C-terminal domain-containing protein [Paenibacillus caseinilyticus]
MTTHTKLPFLDTGLPLEERVRDLVSRLTLEEKIGQMCQYQEEIPRLGIRKYKHGTEGAHGIAWLGEATVFPQNIGLACTWHPELLREIGSAIGDEARVYYQRDPEINGLTIWAPTVDMERDPRWGRTEEAYGEDPYLTGRLSTALVKGLQGDHPFYLKTAATLKHFLGNNNEIGRGECSASIDPRNLREYYLKAFEPAFREGGAQSMMTAYNAVNGTPCNLNGDVNAIVKGEWGMDGFVVSDAGDVLGTVNDHRYFASYAEAVAASVRSGIDSITDDAEITLRAVRDALEAGLLAEADLDRALCNTFRVRIRLGEFDSGEDNPYANVPEEKLCAPEHAKLALQAAREGIVLLKNDGLLPLGTPAGAAVIGPLADVVHTDWYSGTPPYRVTPLAGVRERLCSEGVVHRTGGDRIRIRSLRTGKYVRLSGAVGQTLTADASAAEDAEIFELTDWGWGSTTLKSESRGLFVTESEEGTLRASAEEARGWFVKEAFSFAEGPEGSWVWRSWDGREITAAGEGFLTAGAGGDTGHAAAERFVTELVEDGIRAAAEAARQADTAIVVLGNSPFINGKECVDRPDLTLAPAQEALLRAVMEANPRTVAVLIGSYPFAVNWADDHVPAILYSSHAGQELGQAVADVLFGDYNPGGRLNMTWYRSTDALPDLLDYDIIKGKRTYQYYDGDVLYPFGHGLSYTEFCYRDLQADVTGHTAAVQGGGDAANGSVTLSVTVENKGGLAGDEVVQLYVQAGESRVKRPLKTLAGFCRVHLEPGETQTVTFAVPFEQLAFWDVTREQWCVEKGTYTFMAGGSSAVLPLLVNLAVEGETVPPRRLDSAVFAANYDDYEGVTIEECREGSLSVRSSGSESRIAFYGADLGAGAAAFEARVTAPQPGGTLEIRLDAPDGPAAGRLDVPPTGGWQAWTTVSAGLAGAEGVRDVYLLMRGAVQISWLRLK